MANNLQISTKRVAISRANAQMVLIVAAAAFVTIFCLVASNAVWSQNKYQARVINAKTDARNQLKDNLSAFDKLSKSYADFNSGAVNAIGGNPAGTSDNDGNNTKIILDALPSSYDFPALTASIEKILTDNSFTISGITGTDDQVAQGTNLTSTDPKPVPIPFSFTVTGAKYDSITKLVNILQSSIRPIQVDSISVSGNTDSLELTVNAHTYYQPGKSLSITSKVVK